MNLTPRERDKLLISMAAMVARNRLARGVRLNHPDDVERPYAQFAGKTGTSENKTSQDTRGEETGWFIGYDQNNKDMIMSLYVEDVEDRGMSEYSAKKFAEIHDALNE